MCAHRLIGPIWPNLRKKKRGGGGGGAVRAGESGSDLHKTLAVLQIFELGRFSLCASPTEKEIGHKLYQSDR